MLIQAGGIDIREVSDGYIVYLAATDSVHYLNLTAAMLFELCDGKHADDDIVAVVAQAFGLAPPAHDEIRAGLRALLNEGLVLRSGA